MERKQCGLAIRIFTAVTFLAMVAVNILANTLPINGITTGQVSDSYPNLFAPAGYTFAIWGLIYFLLAAYTLYQLGLFRSPKNFDRADHAVRAGNADHAAHAARAGNADHAAHAAHAGNAAHAAHAAHAGNAAHADGAGSNRLLRQIGIFFSVSSIANIAWIFAWHYEIIPLSMLLMGVILLCLIYITLLINRHVLSPRERLFIRIPFSVYFGWITVATIANVTTLLVSLGWDGFGISEPMWTIIIVTVGMLIGAITTIRNKDIAYGLVLVWAYVGILVKHLSPDGFAGQYTGVVVQVIVSILLLLAAILYVFAQKKNVKGRKL